MEEDKLNSMIEGIKGGEKEAKKEEEKKNITGVLKDLGMQLGGYDFRPPFYWQDTYKDKLRFDIGIFISEFVHTYLQESI